MRKLNFGSGEPFKHLKGYDNADLHNGDINFDFNVFPYPLNNNTYDEILTENTLDHLDDYFRVMKELYRITKPCGVISIKVPFYNSHTSWFPTHKQHFTYYHFYTLTKERHSPEGQQKIINNFKIISFRTIPTLLGRIVPDIKIGERHIGLRYLLGMVFGHIVSHIECNLLVIK